VSTAARHLLQQEQMLSIAPRNVDVRTIVSYGMNDTKQRKQLKLKRNRNKNSIKIDVKGGL
jgi:hypothetical protein